LPYFMRFVIITLLEYLSYKNARYEDRAFYLKPNNHYISRFETFKALSSMNFLRGST
jgi:hypothetical protein